MKTIILRERKKKKDVFFSLTNKIYIIFKHKTSTRAENKPIVLRNHKLQLSIRLCIFRKFRETDDIRAINLNTAVNYSQCEKCEVTSLVYAM